MKVLKTIGIGAGVIFLTFLLFSVWYIWWYAMEPVTTYEVNDPSLENNVLIATQGSEYKNAVEEGVVAYLEPMEVYVRVIDVFQLPEQETEKWDAIVIIHTWEYSKPPEVVNEFLKMNYDPTKVFVITTSGSGEEEMEGVDAITGASKMDNVKRDIDSVILWLNEVFGFE
ncbi:hypothetical protein [Ekhidna sp.]|uniref:hypothetical protein n=1 Tax=Ekhidna sp. TaxID=2608089 RepID=UPI003B5BA7B3